MKIHLYDKRIVVELDNFSNEERKELSESILHNQYIEFTADEFSYHEDKSKEKVYPFRKVYLLNRIQVIKTPEDIDPVTDVATVGIFQNKIIAESKKKKLTDSLYEAAVNNALLSIRFEIIEEELQ